MIRVFSNSKLKTYAQCPRKFKLQYIDKIPIPKGAQTVEALMGTCIHNALKELYQQIMDGSLPTREEVLDHYTNEWESSIHKEIIIPKKGLTFEHFEKSGWEMLAKYYDRYKPFDQSQTIALEKRVQFPLGDFEMMGYIDRLSLRNNNIFEIHDYKTSSAYPTIDDINQDYQLNLYQMGLFSLYPNIEKIELVWHFLKFDQEIVIIRSQEELNFTKENTISEMRKINHDPYFSPQESPLCHWCLYQEFCPAKAHEINVFSFNSSELDQGVEIVEEYSKIYKEIQNLNLKKTALEEVLDEIEKKAVVFAKEKGYDKLIGKNVSLQIKDDWDIQFPKSNEKGRLELETWLKNNNLWEEVSMLQLPKLSKIMKNEKLPTEKHEILMTFSQMSHITKVKLIKNDSDFNEEDVCENQ